MGVKLTRWTQKKKVAQSFHLSLLHLSQHFHISHFHISGGSFALHGYGSPRQCDCIVCLYLHQAHPRQRPRWDQRAPARGPLIFGAQIWWIWCPCYFSMFQFWFWKKNPQSGCNPTLNTANCERWDSVDHAWSQGPWIGRIRKQTEKNIMDWRPKWTSTWRTSVW